IPLIAPPPPTTREEAGVRWVLPHSQPGDHSPSPPGATLAGPYHPPEDLVLVECAGAGGGHHVLDKLTMAAASSNLAEYKRLFSTMGGNRNGTEWR
ncbi:unnamed protein product, partial [Ectocarpus sp. 6 AP-2014]